MNLLVDWDDEIHRALAHPIRRRIIECLQKNDLSFRELVKRAVTANHGKFGYHLKTLKTFVELDSPTKKYRLTYRGKLLAGLIQSFHFTTSIDKDFTDYVQRLELGDHAFGLYDTEYFKHKILFPFITTGLSKGKAVMYLVSEHNLDSETRELQKYLIGVGYLLPKRAFTIMSAEEWYLKKGKAQAKTIVDNWLTLVIEKQKAGFAGMYVAGETEVFFDNAKSEELLRYEALLGRQFLFNLCGLCLYNTNKLEENKLIPLCNSHGHLISQDIIGKITV